MPSEPFDPSRFDEVVVAVSDLDGGSHLTATTTITQTRFGITPYSQLRGALQVGDDVGVRLDALARR